MDQDEDIGDPFVIDDLWRPSRFAFAPIEPLPPLLKGDLDNDFIRLDAGALEKQFIPFPELEQSLVDFSDWKPLLLKTVEPIEDSTLSSESEAVTSVADEESSYEDIWALGEDLTAPRSSNKLLTWDTFLEPQFVEPESAYLSEHGPRGFDTALALRATQRGEKPGRNVENNVYMRALLELGLGRNSWFFKFDTVADTFLQDIEDISLGGISLQAMESVIDDFISCGTNMKKLRSYVHDAMISYHCSPARFSLASAVAVVIFSLESQLDESMPSNVSLLQLNTLFKRSDAITKCLLDLVASTRLTESDEELMSIVFKKSERLIWEHEWLTGLLNEVALRVADPWLILVEGWIGIQPLSGLALGDGASFVNVNRREITNESGVKGVEVEYEMDNERVPSYVNPEHAQLIFEIGKSLQLLSELRPEHPLVLSYMDRSDDAPSLRWVSSWVDLENIQIKANKYENHLRTAIQQYNRGSSTSLRKQRMPNNGDTEETTLPWTADETPQLDPIDDCQLSGRPLARGTAFISDPIYSLLRETKWCQTHCNPINIAPFAPPFSLAPTLSFAPILATQSRLVDFSCIHLLFSEYDLMAHLSVQRRYHLFGDGVFTSRLSQALFDPEMASADRRSGKIRGASSTGLRLGSRDTWPPAHSELRLVLMGLLNDTYFPGKQADHSKSEELPGGLSFSIRELSEEEMDKCKDPNGIEALDFLRLQYKAPRALEAIITPMCLYKYDRLFKFLLRMIRMLAVVRALVRDVTERASRIPPSIARGAAQKFRVDAHHFVSTLCDYALTTAVNQSWQGFEQKLAVIAAYVGNNDFEGTIRNAKSLEHLRESHEEALDHIIFAMFQTKKQTKVRHVLEDIFTAVLEFAPLNGRLANADPGDRIDEDIAKIGELHKRFRKQISLFIRALRSAEEGRGLRKREKLEEAALDLGPVTSERDMVNEGKGFERLLLKLEMSDYYTR